MSIKYCYTQDYNTLHKWVRKELGKAVFCANCYSIDKKTYQWANISKKYKRSIEDWIPLCRKCHTYFDLKNKCKRGHELIKENIYVLKTDRRICKMCHKINRRK